MSGRLRAMARRFGRRFRRTRAPRARTGRVLAAAGSPGEPDFLFIDPPFDLNSAKYAGIPQEVTGYRLMQSLLARLGWDGFAGRKMLDFGCGVRLPRTFVNLGIGIGRYHGVDVDKAVIDWLSENVRLPEFAFTWIDDRNPLYNPAGRSGAGHRDLVAALAGQDFDLACLHSVITHCDPDEARRIFATLRAILPPRGALYFTAFLDDAVAGYAEAGAVDRARSVYAPELLRTLLAEAGWHIERTFPGSFVQQPAILCRP